MFRRNGEKGPNHEAGCKAAQVQSISRQIKIIQLRHRCGTILRHRCGSMSSIQSQTFSYLYSGWLCDLDAKTATLVQGAQGAEAELQLVLPSVFSCVVLCRSTLF